jgi:DNA-binding transcriptional LysR family regulator
MGMTDRLGGIGAFVQAVEAGSFALAGERLHLSSSAISKSIARLEARLGVRLFHRSTRRLALTEEGHAFYEHCTRALAELETAEARLASGRQVPSGRLRVSVPVLFGRRCVAPILLHTARQHRQLALEIAFTDRRVDLVEDGFDLAVRIGPLEDTPGLQARRLGGFRIETCAAPAYLEAHAPPRQPDDLSAHQIIQYGRSGSARPWTFVDRTGRRHAIHVAARVWMDDLDSLADAAIAGMGIARLPSWMLNEHLRSGALSRVLEDCEGESLEINLVWPASPHTPCKLRAAIDALASEVPRLLG